MSPRPLRAFPSFPPRRGELQVGLGARPFPFDGRAWTAPFRFARAAVHAGLRALGVREGDEILMPEYHHGVEVETVRSLGAHVTYYPLEPDLSVRPDAIEPLISARTRVVYVIHYFGFPQPVQALRRLCDGRGLLLFEDCALSLLSADGDVPLGSTGDAAAFCLYKTLPVPDGGVLVLRRPPESAERAEVDFTQMARDSARWIRALVAAPPAPPPRPPSDAPAEASAQERLRAGFPSFDAAQLPLAMSPLTSVLLHGLDLAEVRRRRRRNYFFWADALGDHLDCVRPSIGPGVCPLLFPVRVEDKAALHSALLEDGIEIHNWWHRWYGGSAPGERPGNDRLRRHLVGLPVHQNLGVVELERIRTALQKRLPGQFR